MHLEQLRNRLCLADSVSVLRARLYVSYVATRLLEYRAYHQHSGPILHLSPYNRLDVE